MGMAFEIGGMPVIDVIIPVHNGEQTVAAVVDRLLSLPQPQAWAIRLVVSDDGSTDATAHLLAARAGERMRVLRLGRQGGRANACNKGAEIATGDYLAFIDADCMPVREDYFIRLADQFAAGAQLVYGPITATGETFWPRYLRKVEMGRARRALAGDHALAMTSGNLAVQRSLFEQVGGFSADYTHYGFEDRDLIGRLVATGPRIAFEPGCAVLHDAGNTVRNYCAKMREAARWTAPLFAARHPGMYRRMAFARLDPAFCGSSRRRLLSLAGRWLPRPALHIANALVDRGGVPWWLQAFALRSAAALSYLEGCLQRQAG